MITSYSRVKPFPPCVWIAMSHASEEERPLPLRLVERRVLDLLREAGRVGVDEEQRQAGALVGHSGAGSA